MNKTTFSIIIAIILTTTSALAVDINSCQNITSAGTYMLNQSIDSTGYSTTTYNEQSGWAYCFGSQGFNGNVVIDCQGYDINLTGNLGGTLNALYFQDGDGLGTFQSSITFKNCNVLLNVTGNSAFFEENDMDAGIINTANLSNSRVTFDSTGGQSSILRVSDNTNDGSYDGDEQLIVERSNLTNPDYWAVDRPIKILNSNFLTKTTTTQLDLSYVFGSWWQSNAAPLEITIINSNMNSSKAHYFTYSDSDAQYLKMTYINNTFSYKQFNQSTSSDILYPSVFSLNTWIGNSTKPGYSETCNDLNADGICDEHFTLTIPGTGFSCAAGFVDYPDCRFVDLKPRKAGYTYTPITGVSLPNATLHETFENTFNDLTHQTGGYAFTTNSLTGSYSLNNTDPSNLYLNTSQTFNFNQNWTMSFWIKNQQGTNNNRAFSGLSTLAGIDFLDIYINGNFAPEVGYEAATADSSGGTDFADEPGYPATNNYYLPEEEKTHITAEYVGNTDEIKIYVNSLLEGSHPVAATGAGSIPLNVTEMFLYLGQSGGLSPPYDKYLIDDLRLYNAILNQTQKNAIYNSSFGTESEFLSTPVPPNPIPNVSSCNTPDNNVGCNENAAWTCNVNNATSVLFQVNLVNNTGVQNNATTWTYTRTHTDTTTINETLTLQLITASSANGTNTLSVNIPIQHDCTIAQPQDAYNPTYSSTDLTPSVFDFVIGILAGLAGLGVLLGIAIVLNKGLNNMPYLKFKK